MASAKKDFEGFVRWLHLPQNAVGSNVRRLANLVLENFESILSSSRQSSRRSIFLAEIARRDLLQTSDTQPDIASKKGSGLRFMTSFF